MRELSLFTGAGGGLLASHLLGWTPLGYVEANDYRQRVLAARIRDGLIPRAPLFGDVRAFIDQGYAEAYSGLVDVVSGGFPCQPFSTASRGRARTDKDRWPEMLGVVRIVQPSFVCAENVAKRAIDRAAIDLDGLGYTCRVARLSALEFGAVHERPRWWVVAHADGKGESRRTEHEEVAGVSEVAVAGWPDHADIVGGADGVAHRMDRLAAIGDGQVPCVAAAAWELLRP